MRWIGRRQSSNIEDRREAGGGGLGGGGFPGGFNTGGGDGPRIPIGFPSGGGAKTGGGIGIGTIVIILIGMWLLGINPLELLSGMSGGGSPVVIGQGSGQTTGQTTGKVGTPSDDGAKFVSLVLADTEDTWTALFQKSGETYQTPTLVLFSGNTQSACGFATAASGPFYCPGDRKVYID